MNRIVRRYLTLAVCAGCSLALSAGVVVQQEHGDIGGSKPKDKTTLSMDSGKIRVETTDGSGAKTIMIFDGDKQVLWVIQPRGEYMEMTAADVEKMAQMGQQASREMDNAMKQMQAQMANMPPEQRAMMEQMMKQRMGSMPGPAAPPTITYQRKGGGQKVGSFSCTMYDELSNGQRSAELCVASADQLKIYESEIKTLDALAKFMEPLRRMSQKGGWSAPPVRQLQGFPVRTVAYDGARPVRETTVLSVEQKSVDAGQFTLPAGLKKQAMPWTVEGRPR